MRYTAVQRWLTRGTNQNVMHDISNKPEYIVIRNISGVYRSMLLFGCAIMIVVLNSKQLFSDNTLNSACYYDDTSCMLAR
jgi:hypothetical protein